MADHRILVEAEGHSPYIAENVYDLVRWCNFYKPPEYITTQIGSGIRRVWTKESNWTVWNEKELVSTLVSTEAMQEIIKVWPCMAK